MRNASIKPSLLMLSLAAVYPAQGIAAVPAGVAQFTAGDVNLRSTDGKTDPLTKGKDIESGQAIITGVNGRAQVRFSDGGLISLQPNTEFKIANYVDKADPKEDRFLVDLLRGSMRAITGLIGKRNRENYKVMTTTATIGIRGSGFNAGYNPDGSLGVTAEKDAIEVCNAGVCVGLVAGESVQVTNSTTPPARTVNKASVPTPDAAQEVVTAGNQTTADGKSTVKDTRVAETVKVAETVTVVPPVVRTFTDIQVSAVGSDVSFNTPVLRTAAGATTVFSDSKLTQFTDTSFGTPKWFESGTAAPLSSFKSIGNVSDANFIGWGMWTKGTRDYFGTLLLDQVHYVAGRPTSASNVSALSGSYTYSLVGSTAPTRNGVVGTLTSATFTVGFSTGYSVNVAVNTSFGNFTDSATGASSSSFTGTNGFITGMFIGSNAAFAGLTYAKDPGGGKITGALAFQKP